MKVLTTKINARKATISVSVLLNNKRYKIHEYYNEIQIYVYCDNGLGLIADWSDIEGLEEIDPTYYSESAWTKTLMSNVDIAKEYIKLLFCD